MGKGRRVLYWSIAGAVTLAVVGVAAGPITSRVEQPAYTVLTSDGPIEFRAYGSMIAAEAVLHGDRSAVLSEGFQLIAAYIFGANKQRVKIAMTAPVEQQGAQTTVMTAPTVQPVNGDTWIVRFIMPRGWTKETLPVPDDSRVALKPVEARTMIAIRFAGFANGSSIVSKTDELRRYALAHGIQTLGEPLLAFYNPPWTLPFLRRNEVMFQVQQG